MEKKTETITIRIDAEMKSKLEEVAARDRRTLSQYVYLLIEGNLLDNGCIIPCQFNPRIKA